MIYVYSSCLDLDLKKRGDRAFTTAGPKLWNSLPLHIRLAPSISDFKSALKTYLYTVAVNTLDHWFSCCVVIVVF